MPGYSCSSDDHALATSKDGELMIGGERGRTLGKLGRCLALKALGIE